jgi:hypothetical protein
MRSAFARGRLFASRLLAREPLGPQPLTVGIKRLLRGLMVAHGLFGLDPARSIARLALFRCQGFASEGKIFCHGKGTRWWGKSSTRRTGRCIWIPRKAPNIQALNGIGGAPVFKTGSFGLPFPRQGALGARSGSAKINSKTTPCTVAGSCWHSTFCIRGKAVLTRRAKQGHNAIIPKSIDASSPAPGRRDRSGLRSEPVKTNVRRMVRLRSAGAFTLCALGRGLIFAAALVTRRRALYLPRCFRSPEELCPEASARYARRHACRQAAAGAGAFEFARCYRSLRALSPSRPPLLRWQRPLLWWVPGQIRPVRTRSPHRPNRRDGAPKGAANHCTKEKAAQRRLLRESSTSMAVMFHQ